MFCLVIIGITRLTSRSSGFSKHRGAFASLGSKSDSTSSSHLGDEGGVPTPPHPATPCSSNPRHRDQHEHQEQQHTAAAASTITPSWSSSCFRSSCCSPTPPRPSSHPRPPPPPPRRLRPGALAAEGSCHRWTSRAWGPRKPRRPASARGWGVKLSSCAAAAGWGQGKEGMVRG